MKTSTKTITFLIIAFIIILGITFFTRPAVAPVVTETPTPSVTPTGDLKYYTMADISRHATEVSCWTTIDATVYDVTSFIDKHPGGKDKILGICGKDGTSAFTGQHDGQQAPMSQLLKLRIGFLTQPTKI